MNEPPDTTQSLEPHDIARRFSSKPGFRLIDYRQVALPVFVVDIDAIVIAPKPLPLADEFLLRSIAEGVDTPDDIAGFLGLEAMFVKKRLGELIGQDLVAYNPSEGGIARANLTAKGKDARKQAMVVQPKRESFVIACDGITRQALAALPQRLLAGRDVRAFGLLEIRAFPEDKTPEFSEIARMNLTEALAGGQNRDKKIRRVMSLVHMGKRSRRYREATMLIFRAERGSQIHVEFFIDGRPSPTLSNAFAQHDGVKALHIPEQVAASNVSTKEEIKSVLPDLEDSKEAKKSESELNSPEDRFLEVHEHRPLFDRSLREARSRLLIVAPWIRDTVLHRNRLNNVQHLVERGVEVFIGYGLGKDDKPGWDKGDQAIHFLNNLTQRYPNLHIHKFGDTHAKILLIDDSFAVIGSFNWLSFEGDSRGDFREEMSFRCNKKEEIDRLFQYYLERFLDRKAVQNAPCTPATAQLKASASSSGARFNTPRNLVNEPDEIKRFRKAAEQGAADAQYILGQAYNLGQVVSRDDKEAAKWFRNAAIQGHADAQSALGYAFYNGHGVPQDLKESVTWFRKAAEQGNAVAQHNLGLAYANGRGVSQCFVEAYKWASLASASGLKHCIESRDKLENRMPSTEIVEGKKRAAIFVAKKSSTIITLKSQKGAGITS